MRTTVLGIIGSFIIMPVYGQHFVKGKIIDSENAVMPMVNVAFLNQSDSTLVTGAVSDSCGIYTHHSMVAAILSAIPIWAMRRCIRIYLLMRTLPCR